MINSLDKNDSLREWERLEKSKARMFSKIDACLSEMNSDDADTRKHGLESLKRELSSMTSEDRVIFTITHSLRNCDIQEKLYEMMKKKKSPRVTGATSPELLQIMDLIQGLSLLHYESKQLASRSQRMAVILTYLATKDLKLVVYTLEALEAILVDSCTNLRSFEFNGGLKLLCNILKQNKANENLVHKFIEFFVVYLLPEDDFPDRQQENYRARNEKLSMLEQLMGPAFVEHLSKTLEV